jgi:hypothetical protein
MSVGTEEEKRGEQIKESKKEGIIGKVVRKKRDKNFQKERLVECIQQIGAVERLNSAQY